MTLFFRLAGAALISAILPFSAQAATSTLDPTDMRGLRLSATATEPELLNFSAVKDVTEDRTIAHFDITGLGSFASASLHLSMQNQDDNGTMEVYSFAGDGVVSIDEWGSGTFLTSFSTTPTSEEVDLDITAALMAAIGNGDSFFSLRLSNDGLPGRYFLSHVINGNYGTISSAGPSYISLTTPAVPLPAGGLLLISGLGAIALRRRLS